LPYTVTLWSFAGHPVSCLAPRSASFSTMLRGLVVWVVDGVRANGSANLPTRTQSLAVAADAAALASHRSNKSANLRTLTRSQGAAADAIAQREDHRPDKCLNSSTLSQPEAAKRPVEERRR
jgi:hypothetical protein